MLQFLLEWAGRTNERRARARFAKAIALGSLAVLLLLSAPARADGWSATLEVEHERITSPPPALWTDSLAAIISFRAGLHQLDFKLEGGRDEDFGQGVGGKVELRYRLHLPTALGIKTSVRVSLGENISPGYGGTFPYFTVQPKIAYVLPFGIQPYVSARYRDALDAERYFRTFTYYGGVSFQAFDSWSIEPSVFHKVGDECSNGMKLELSRSF
ncbi:MAG: hypothetical protein U0359_39060 [Byssovorax sp.]